MHQAHTIQSVETPPYPKLGEIYRQIALALDTKAKNRDVDRLAREGEFDWSVLSTLAEELLTAPLRKFAGPVFATFIERHLQHIHKEYVELVLTVALDSLNRDEALPLLIEHFFAIHGANLLKQMAGKFDGPDINTLLDPKYHPVLVVLRWIGNGDVPQLLKAVYPNTTDADKTQRDTVARWATGQQLPDLQSIKRFTDSLKMSRAAQVENARVWLLIARALAFLETESPIPLRSVMQMHIDDHSPIVDVGAILGIKVHQESEKLSALKMPVLLLYEELKRTTPKTLGDQVKTKQDLMHVGELLLKHDPAGRTRFHYEWLLGRWHALSGDLLGSLPHYERAFTLADYRDGPNQKRIIEECLGIAGQVGSRVLIKRLKNKAIAFGLFQNPTEHVLESWETEQFRQQFHQTFPVRGRFPEAGSDAIDDPQLPFLHFDLEEMAAKKVDLRSPDRIYKVKSSDGQIRRWSQLYFFASIGRTDAVAQLLDAGANVDHLDDSGGSALLCAIQLAENSGQRDSLDILLERKHATTTLNQATAKKRFTPLLCAVEFGEPDVVEKLLQMGASPDRRGLVSEQTPLYLCVENLGVLLSPQKCFKTMLDRLSEDPHLVQQEIRRRYNVTLAGVFGDGFDIRSNLQNPDMRALFNKLVADVVRGKMKNFRSDQLIRIMTHLLDHGANPNDPHKYPASGRTPLMLASENDSAEAFDLLLKRGGDPLLRDANGKSCIQIAQGFGSQNVLHYMQKNGIV